MVRQKKQGLKAVLYIRVSSDKQADEGLSLEAQEDRLRAYCSMRGLEIVEVVSDPAKSAFKPLTGRPGGRKVLSLLKAKKVDAVVALKLDRLFRNVVDCLQTVEAWDKQGIALHLVDLGGIALDTSSATGKMFLTMLSAFGEFERNMTSERTRLALALKFERGELRVGRDAPYGYRYEGDGMVEEHAEQAVIGLARTLQEKGLSLAKIASVLSADGYRNRAGEHFARQSIHTMLTGPSRLAPAE